MIDCTAQTIDNCRKINMEIGNIAVKFFSRYFKYL